MELIPNDKLRIVDANLNRIGEGLRVLEELTRLSLNDVDLTQQLKNMRHGMVRCDKQLQQRLIQARESECDVGIDIEVADEEERGEISETIVANSRRVQESLRVMDELAKTAGLGLAGPCLCRQGVEAPGTLPQQAQTDTGKGARLGRPPGVPSWASRGPQARQTGLAEASRAAWLGHLAASG